MERACAVVSAACLVRPYHTVTRALMTQIAASTTSCHGRAIEKKAVLGTGRYRIFMYLQEPSWAMESIDKFPEISVEVKGIVEAGAGAGTVSKSVMYAI